MNEEEVRSAFRHPGGEGLQEAQLGVTGEMMQVISAQNVLIMKLLQRQNILCRQLASALSSDSGSGNDKPHAHPQNLEFSSSSSPLEQLNAPPTLVFPKPRRPARRPPQNSESEADQAALEEEEAGSEFREQRGRVRQPETKNMIKNFSKAIFGFTSRQRETRERVAQWAGVEEGSLASFLERNRGRVHSIAELRGLWTREDDLGRAFRALSCEYLRRHCLERTFNSRVENYGVHLKYRQRLLAALRRPHEFTSLKFD